MRRQISKMLMACVMAMTLMVVSAASAFAAGTGMDWSGDSKITVQGTGVAPTYAVNAIQARMLARRAAVVDAYRQLAELVKGVNVSATTFVSRSILKPGTYSGHFPFDDNASWVKNAAVVRQLSKLRERVRNLERQLSEQQQ